MAAVSGESYVIRRDMGQTGHNYKRVVKGTGSHVSSTG